MTDEKINELLNALADATEEPAPSTLNETIEHQIPKMLTAHRGGWDTINIIIDLRVSRLVAAAVIIATMFLLAGLFGSHNGGDDIYQDSKMLIRYCLKGENASTTNIISGMSKFCEYLVNRGKEVTYYGETVNPADKDAILLHWKLSDGSYRVIFSDLRIAVATPEELIKLQAKMLQKKPK